MSKRYETRPNAEDARPSESFQRKMRYLYAFSYIWTNRTRHDSRKNSVPGRVFYYTAMRFNKTVISIAGQIQLLESSRMLYGDKESALHFLSNINLHSFFAVFNCLHYLLRTICPCHPLKVGFKELLYKYPNIDMAAMGFSYDWEEEILWQPQSSMK